MALDIMGQCVLTLNVVWTAGVVLAIVLPAASIAAGEDWPQWRGPRRDGKSIETALLEKWPAGGPRMLWSANNLGGGFSTVAIADALIYVTGLKGDEGVFHVLTMDGKLKWEVNYGAEWAASGRYPGVRCVPTVDKTLVCVFSGFGRLTCYDAETGRPL